jgi:hypothetical protein
MGNECCSHMATPGTKEQGTNAANSQDERRQEEEIFARPGSSHIEGHPHRKKGSGLTRATPVPNFPTKTPRANPGAAGGILAKTVPLPNPEPLWSGRPLGKAVGSDRPQIMHVHDVRTFLSHGVRTSKAPPALSFLASNALRPSSPIPEEESKGTSRSVLRRYVETTQVFMFPKRREPLRRQGSGRASILGADQPSFVEPSMSPLSLEENSTPGVQYVVVESLGIDTFGESYKVQNKETSSLHTLTAVSKSVYELMEDYAEQLYILQQLVL